MNFTLDFYAEPIWGGKGEYPKTMRDAAGNRLPAFSEKEKVRRRYSTALVASVDIYIDFQYHCYAILTRLITQRQSSRSSLPPSQKLINGSSDFFGLNHYSTRAAGRPSATTALQCLPREIRSLWSGMGSAGKFLNAIKPMVNPFAASYFKDMDISPYPDPAGTEYTTMRWAIAPRGFRSLLNYIHNKYHPVGGIIITENGLASQEDTKEVMEVRKCEDEAQLGAKRRARGQKYATRRFAPRGLRRFRRFSDLTRQQQSEYARRRRTRTRSESPSSRATSRRCTTP
jgi:hypothetical protein